MRPEGVHYLFGRYCDTSVAPGRTVTLVGEAIKPAPYPPQVFDFLLGHKSAGMAGVYTHLNPAGGILAEASQATADWIAAAMAGKNLKLGEKVKREKTTEECVAG